MRAIKSQLTIGALAQESEVSIDSIRYYERVGIMPKPPRSAGGHRLFANEHKQRLVFIRRARELGFSLDDVRALLGLTGGRRVTCARAKRITEQHIADIRQKAKDLKRLAQVLTQMVAQCRGDESPDCPILETLADWGAPLSPKKRRELANVQAQTPRST
jgi:MerR family transcriptional regulator, mercuric resistance operon regulatory protein